MPKFVIFLLFVSSSYNFGECQESNTLTDKDLLSPEFYVKAHKIMKNSKAFFNFTLQDTKNLANDVQTWEPPADLVERFPYYLAGYDFDDRPVWVTEAGNYNLTNLFEVSSVLPILEKFVFKVAINVFKSMIEKDSVGKEVRQLTALVDHEGMDLQLLLENLKYFDAIAFGIKKADQYLDLMTRMVGQVIIINGNYATRLGIDLLRPIVGELMERCIILDTDKYKWRAELRRLLPDDSIPTWYGGSKKLKRLAVHG